MSVTLRDFKEQDLDRYLQLSRDFYSSDAVDHAVPEKFFRHTFEACIKKSPYARGLMIEYEGKSAGYLLLSFTHSNEVGGLVVLIEEVLICPEYRGKGIAGKVFDFLSKEYDGKVSRYRLEVTRHNRHAIEIYKHYGYQEIQYMSMVRDLV